MKKELFNGNAIPYDLSFEELNRMLFSDDMTEFCLACEALSCRDDSESFNALKSFLKHPDKYRRLYAMKQCSEILHPQNCSMFLKKRWLRATLFS